MKLKPIIDNHIPGAAVGFVFFCPGCQQNHAFFITGGKAWTFDGNRETPTFSPSLLNTCPDHPDPKQRRCHLNLTAGKLIYHADSSHDLAGKVIDLPDFPEVRE